MGIFRLKKNHPVTNLISRLGFLTAGKFMSLFTIPVISRALGPVNYGLYHYAITIASYAFLLANWGFLAKGIREIAKQKQSNKSGYIVQYITSGRVVLWAVGVVVGLFICVLIFGFSQLVFYIFLAMIANLGVALTIDYYFYALKNVFIPSLCHFLSQLLFLLLIILFIKNEDDLKLILVFNIVYRILEAFFLFYYFLKDNYFSFQFSIKNSYSLIRDNFSLGLGSKIDFFQNSFPILIIPFFFSQFDLGVFTAAFKFFLLITMFLQTLNLVYSPFIVEARGKNLKFQKSFFWKLMLGYIILGLSSTFMIWYASDQLVDLLFGNKFTQSKELIKKLAIFLMPIWPVYTILISYMNNLEKDKEFLKGGILTVVCIAIFIPIGIINAGLNGIIYGLSLSTILACFYYLKIILLGFNSKADSGH